MVSCSPKKALVCTIAGTVLCVGAGIIFFYIPDIVDGIASLMLALTSSSILYPLWKDIPVPMYRQFYMFNYTNFEEFKKHCTNEVCSVKLQVQELGPYSYREVRHKKTIKFGSDDTVSYREIHNFVFDPETSNGSESDLITTPDIVLFAIPIILLENGKIDTLHAPAGGNSPTPYVVKSARELIYSGYFDPLAFMGQTVLLHREVIPGAIFAMFYGKNATEDSPYVINTGGGDISEIFEINKWNNSDTLPFWKDKCKEINGSDGTMYSPRTSGDTKKVNIFVSDICRSIFLDYVEETTFHNFKGSKYASTLDLFADPNMNPDNGCFCNPNDTICLGSGVTYLGPCKFNAPIYLSHPHFYMSDYRFVDAVDGLNPQEELHRSFLSIEKYSGMPFTANIRFQLSVLIYPFSIAPVFDHKRNLTYEIHEVNYPKMLLPVMWVNERAELDQASMDMLNDDLYIPIKAIYGVVIGVIIIGGLLALFGITYNEYVAVKTQNKIRRTKAETDT